MNTRQQLAVLCQVFHERCLVAFLCQLPRSQLYLVAIQQSVADDIQLCIRDLSQHVTPCFCQQVKALARYDGTDIGHDGTAFVVGSQGDGFFVEHTGLYAVVDPVGLQEGPMVTIGICLFSANRYQTGNQRTAGVSRQTGERDEVMAPDDEARLPDVCQASYRTAIVV